MMTENPSGCPSASEGRLIEGSSTLHRFAGAVALAPEVVASAIHDLANLLDAATRSAALGRGAVEPKAAGVKPDAKSAARHLARVEATLRSMSRILGSLTPERPGKRGLEWHEPHTLEQAMAHAVEIMHSAADAVGARIEMASDPKLAGFSGDGFLRILTNAIRNSIESIARASNTVAVGAGVIAVHAEIRMSGAGVSEVHIEVIDDGVGPPEDLSPSTGVGLSSARGYLTSIGGTVALRRSNGTAPGRPGARLIIRVPVTSLNRVVAREGAA